MRRARRRLALSGAAALALSACGFELRRAPQLHFQRIQLAGFAPKSPLAAELRGGLEAIEGTTVVDSAAQAQVVFDALADARDRSVVASTATGLVREVQLRARLQFRLRTPAGKELIAPTEIVQVRELSFNEGVALAKQYEEAALFRNMQSDIVAQVIRRLAAVTAL